MTREQAKAASKETKATIRSNQRQMDRDIRECDRQDNALLAQIKARAREPGVKPTTDSGLKAQAKQLVQPQKQQEKLYETKAPLIRLGMQATAMTGQVSCVTAIGSVTALLLSANKVMDTKKMASTMNEFAK